MRKLRWLVILFGCLLSPGCQGDFFDSQPSAVAHDAFPDDWFYFGAERPASLREMEGRPAPELNVERWLGGSTSLDELKGKVVVVDFWATWCGACVDALPKNVELVEKYSQRGLEMVGVHDSRRGHQHVPGVARDVGINYRLCVDSAGRSANKWNIEFWPSYFLVDQQGIVRAAGLNPESLEQAILDLLESNDLELSDARETTGTADQSEV